jgi:DNA polymerase-3 subunit beta
MNLSIESKKLLSGLEIVKPVITSNRLIPVMDNVLIKTDEDCIVLIGMNGDHSIMTQIPCEVRTKVNALIPFMDIYNMCKLLPEQTLSINFNAGTINIECLSGSYQIQETDSVKDFPAFQLIDEPENDCVLSSTKDLSQIENRTAKFIHPDPIVMNMHGVCFDFEGEELNVISSDKNCISVFKIDCKAKVNAKYLLHKRTIELLSVMTKRGDVTFKFSKDKFQAENEDVIMVCPLIGQAFPNYKPSLKDLDFVMEVDRVEFLVSLIRSQKFSMVDFATIEFSKNMINIVSDNTHYGKDFKERITPSKLTGYPTGHKIDVNIKYLIDCLSGCESTKVQISATDKKGSALTVREVGSDRYVFQMSTLLLRPENYPVTNKAAVV